MTRIYIEIPGALAAPGRLADVNRESPVADGALMAIEALTGMRHEILPVALTNNPDPTQTADLIGWLRINFPDLAERLVVVPDLSCIGDDNDYLVTGPGPKTGLEGFEGWAVNHSGANGWGSLLGFFRAQSRHPGREVA